jgi:peptidoglycan-associated lipoprotein
MSRMSSPSGLAMATAGLSVAFTLAAACSHEEKKEPAHPVAQPAPARTAPQPAAKPPTEEVAEAPKAKEEPAVFFDFDSSLIKDDGRRVLQDVADNVRKQNASLEIEGNCDELGTTEYNLALGEARARAAKEYLVHLGVPSKKIATVSYGSQRPRYPGHDDDAHAKNRRDDLVIR